MFLLCWLERYSLYLQMWFQEVHSACVCVGVSECRMNIGCAVMCVWNRSVHRSPGCSETLRLWLTIVWLIYTFISVLFIFYFIFFNSSFTSYFFLKWFCVGFFFANHHSSGWTSNATICYLLSHLNTLWINSDSTKRHQSIFFEGE